MVKRSVKFTIILTSCLMALLGAINVVFAQGPDRESTPSAPRRVILETLANVMGLTTEELRNELKSGKKLAEIAEEQNITRAELAEALYAAAVDRLDQAVANGRIEPARAEQIRQRLTDRRDACLNEGDCQTDVGRLFERLQMQRRQANRQHVKTLADVLSMPVDELVTALCGGQTVSAIAEARGLTQADLANSLFDVAVDRLDKAVANGQIEPARAEQIRQRLTERRDACVNEGDCQLR
jgi:uncharacterized protein YidB (DUF937 family)